MVLVQLLENERWVQQGELLAVARRILLAPTALMRMLDRSP
jgi:hypothetical protein